MDKTTNQKKMLTHFFPSDLLVGCKKKKPNNKIICLNIMEVYIKWYWIVQNNCLIQSIVTNIKTNVTQQLGFNRLNKKKYLV